MELSSSVREEIGFKEITVLKSHPLGAGSYGAVYKAKCDRLLCAAKLLHPTLFNLSSPAGGGGGGEGAGEEGSSAPPHRLPVRRFEQECAFLASIRHPNVVQYLGTHQDRATGLPVLLMELMDCSLTQLLDEEPPRTPLPLHAQLDISRDVALALSFLHSNHIIHRDLSSNNVLMVGDRRAKVTDFGMAMVFAHYAQTRTSVPGTAVYMPPQALRESPRYTLRLDCFTFGVLLIQIMTCQFPKPGPRLARVEGKEGGGGGGGVLYREVPEGERRRNHISLIAPDHPLLELAMECISDEEADRPSADLVVERLEQVRTLPLYAESQNTWNTVRNDAHRTVQYISSLETMLREKDEKIQSLASELQKQQQDSSATSSGHRGGEDLSLAFREGRRAKRAMYRHCNAMLSGDIIFFLCADMRTLFYAYRCPSREWVQLPEVDVGGGEWHTNTAAVTYGCLTTVGGYDEDENPTNRLFSLITRDDQTRWEELLPPMPTERDGSTAIAYGHHLVVAGGVARDDCYLQQVEILDMDMVQWFVAMPLPEPLANASWTLHGNSNGGSTAYLLGGWFSLTTPTCSVLSCDLERLIQSQSRYEAGSSHVESGPSTHHNQHYHHEQVWSRIADLPVLKSTCVTFRNRLLAVGGVDPTTNRPVEAVRMYDWTLNSWRVVGRMLVARGQAFVTVLPSGEELMVVGGHKGYYLNKIYEVELGRVVGEEEEEEGGGR